MSTHRKIRVLFVCLGNICRSPMAEAVFAHLVCEAGLQDFVEVDSAGTGDWHIDSAAHPGTLFMLEQNGISYDGQGRQIRAEDLKAFDYVITMDDENLSNVRRLGKGTAHVAPLMSYVPDTDIGEVPDPYFTNGFEVVYMLVHEGCVRLLEAIRLEHDL